MAQRKLKKIKHRTPQKAKVSSAKTDPMARAVFFRPERYSYVREQDHSKRTADDCVFCRAAQGPKAFDHLKVWESERIMVLLNKFPYNSGHVLILPKRHVGEMDQLTVAEAQEMGVVLRAVVKILKSTYKCQGLNVGMNLGAVAGAGIPGHLHTHVVPRWSGDTNFFPLLAQTKLVIERLEDTFARLVPLFEQERIL